MVQHGFEFLCIKQGTEVTLIKYCRLMEVSYRALTQTHLMKGGCSIRHLTLPAVSETVKVLFNSNDDGIEDLFDQELEVME